MEFEDGRLHLQILEGIPVPEGIAVRQDHWEVTPSLELQNLTRAIFDFIQTATAVSNCTISSATPVADAGFCPVTRRSLTTMCF